MELEAQNSRYIDSNIAMVMAHTEVIDLCWAGVLDVSDPLPQRPVLPGFGALDDEQWQVVHRILESVKKNYGNNS